MPTPHGSDPLQRPVPSSPLGSTTESQEPKWRKPRKSPWTAIQFSGSTVESDQAGHADMTWKSNFTDGVRMWPAESLDLSVKQQGELTSPSRPATHHVGPSQ